MKDITDSWNAMSEQVSDQNIPSFIAVARTIAGESIVDRDRRH
jgi:hypothetical protein